MSKSNQTIAGYHLLMILSTVDEKIIPEADYVIREYLSEEAPFPLNLDNELDEIIMLEKDQFESHFVKKAQDFYLDSTEEERIHFTEFSKKLLRADNYISPNENKYYKTLLTAWKNMEE